MEMGILGDLVVLAMFAAEIAAHCGNGIGKGAGQQVKDGFFFDGVDVFADQAAVVEAVKDPALIFPDLADPAASFANQAMVMAEQAADMSGVIDGLFVKERFVHGHPPRRWACYVRYIYIIVLIHKPAMVVNKKISNLFQWITVLFHAWRIKSKK